MFSRVAAGKNPSPSKTAETVREAPHVRRSDDSDQQSESTQARAFVRPRFSWNIGKVALHAPDDRNQPRTGGGGSSGATRHVELPPPLRIQAKLEVGAADDPLEHEADRVAEQVMRMPDTGAVAPPAAAGGGTAGVRRKCSCGETRAECRGDHADEEHGTVHRKPAGPQVSRLGSSPASSGMTAPRIVHEVLNSPGRPLDSATRAFMEPKFGHDFSKVRVHSDGEAEESARAVNALAYTVGHDIVFGSAQYAPSSSAGRRLLSHELTHVAQQASVTAPQILRRDSPTPAAGEESSLEDILPSKIGLVAAIDRQVLLKDIFGEHGLSQLVEEVKANPLALAFTRRTGILGLLALVDTRGAQGLDPGKAEATLKADKQHVVYQRELLQPRNDAPKSFWFQKNPPAQKGQQGPEDIPSVTSNLSDVVQDPQNPVPIPAPISGGRPVGPAISVNFAFKGSDLIGGRPSTELRQGRARVVDAIKKVSVDIGSIPPAPSAAARTQDEQVRARLREAVRGFSGAKPLNIFLASGEEQAVLDPSPRTEAIFVRLEDIGDDKKLEAAIRLPLVAFLGGSSGSSTALTANEAGETLLHEMVHDLLLRSGLSANDLWEKIRAKAAEGPPTVKNRCEEMIHRFLLAQEEVFVYDNVSKLGPEYSSLAGINQPRYELWSLRAEAFFKKKGVTLIKTTNKLAVSDKVAGKKVDWTIDFKIPDPMTVTGADLTPLNEVVHDFPG
jgi:Domain of unknown function (DUF4157)